MTKSICVILILLVTLACGAATRGAPVAAGCTLLGTVNPATTPAFEVGRHEIDYILEVTRCDDYQLADYYSCKGTAPPDESIFVGPTRAGTEEKPIYYKSRQCDGADLPEMKLRPSSKDPVEEK
jgi:hypothetical protein